MGEERREPHGPIWARAHMGLGLWVPYGLTCMYISITNVLVRVSGLRTAFSSSRAYPRFVVSWALQDTANTAPQPLGRSKTPQIQHRSHLGAQKHRKYSTGATWALESCSSPHCATGALEMAARAPARCPQGARRSFSNPCSVPQGARSGCSSPCSVPQGVQSGCSSFCSVPQCIPSGLPHPLLGAPGAPRAAFLAPTRCHRVARARFCVMSRSKRRSEKLSEGSVLGYTQPL